MEVGDQTFQDESQASIRTAGIDLDNLYNTISPSL